jgi:hypothetical protein
VEHSGSFLPSYLSTRTMAAWLSVLLLFTAATFSVSAGFEISEVRLLVGALSNDSQVSTVDRYAHSLMRNTLAMMRIGLVGISALLFGSWLYRSRINGRAFGARRFQYPRKWALLGFVVPLLNLIRPLQVVCEVWRVSDPRATENPFDWKVIEVPRFVHAWWWMLVGCAGFECLAMVLTQTTSVTLGQLTLARVISVFADLGATGAAVLGYLIVVGISTAQDRKWAILSGVLPADEFTPPSEAIRDPAIAAML